MFRAIQPRRRMPRRPAAIATLVVAAILTPLALARFSSAAPPRMPGAVVARIVVEPSILMSRDARVPHAEFHSAAHPTDPKKLVAMTIIFPEYGSQWMNELYATDDGGQTWKSIIHPHQFANGSGDPRVGYSKRGTAIALALTLGDRLGMW